MPRPRALSACRALGLVLAALFVPSGPSQATTVVAVDGDGLVRRSELIVHGTCIACESYRNARGLIVTRYTFQVIESLKGSVARELTIEQPGGVYRGVRTMIPGLSSHRVGDEVVLFLSAASKGQPERRLPIGFDQGVYRVRAPESGAQPVVSRRSPGLHIVQPPARPDTETSKGERNLPENVDVQTFKTAVRKKMREQSK